MKLNNFNIGDLVTAKTLNLDGDTIHVSGKIASINGDVIFITKRFPKIEHFSVKADEIITGDINAKQKK